MCDIHSQRKEKDKGNKFLPFLKRTHFFSSKFDVYQKSVKSQQNTPFNYKDVQDRKLKMASNIEKIEERSVIQEHSLEVDGTMLNEKKVVTTCSRKGSDTPCGTEKLYTRWIGDRFCSAVEEEENNDAAKRTVNFHDH